LVFTFGMVYLLMLLPAGVPNSRKLMGPCGKYRKSDFRMAKVVFFLEV
jgi:hypothetical protein